MIPQSNTATLQLAPTPFSTITLNYLTRQYYNIEILTQYNTIQCNAMKYNTIQYNTDSEQYYQTVSTKAASVSFVAPLFLIKFVFKHLEFVSIELSQKEKTKEARTPKNNFTQVQKQLARACGVPVGRRSGGRLATTLVDTINVIIFHSIPFFPCPPFHFLRNLFS